MTEPTVRRGQVWRDERGQNRRVVDVMAHARAPGGSILVWCSSTALFSAPLADFLARGWHLAWCPSMGGPL